VADLGFIDETLGPLRGRGFAPETPPVAPPAPAETPAPDLARRADALAKWRRRSRQVRFFRKALPAAIGAIILFGVVWVGVRAIVAALAHGGSELGSIHLINPTFYGRNEKGELYIMAASEAVRDGDDPDRITLVNPDLKQYPAGAPAPMTTRALHGVYHQQKKLLDLTGHVVATDGRGYTFQSEFAHVDMIHNSAVGNAHVHSFGPSGSITADAYQVYDKGQHAIFTGHVLTHLTNAPAAKTPPRPAAQPVLPAGALPVPYQIFHHGGPPAIRPPI
jgi:lipopolysaccharide export system protein LptC